MRLFAMMFMLSVVLMLAGCMGQGGKTPTNQTMTCSQYCPTQPHAQCTGNWVISGTYPNCNCRFECEQTPPANNSNMTCGVFCARQPHEMCPHPSEGAWNVSGVYPDCKCRFDCTNITGGNYSNVTGNYSGKASVSMNASANKFSPANITVNSSQLVNLTIYNRDPHMHTFTMESYGINVQLPPNSVVNVAFIANKPGVYPFRCTIHPQMTGSLTVTNVTMNATGNATGNGTGNVSLNINAIDGDFSPNMVNVALGAMVTITVHNSGTKAHTFTMPSYGIDVQLPINATSVVSFLADKPGAHPFVCTLHPGMDGTMMVTGNVSGNGTGNNTNVTGGSSTGGGTGSGGSSGGGGGGY